MLMERIITLLFSNSVFFSWLIPETMKGSGLQGASWLSSFLNNVNTSNLVISLISFFAAETVLFFIAEAVIRRFYIANVRRLIRYGYGTEELRSKIDSFHIPKALNDRLKMEVIKQQNDSKEQASHM